MSDTPTELDVEAVGPPELADPAVKADTPEELLALVNGQADVQDQPEGDEAEL